MFRAPVRPGLELRLFEERHAPAAFALVNQDRAYLRPWLAWVDSTESADDTLSYIQSSLQQFAAGKTIATGIWFENQFAGSLGMHNISKLMRKAEIGYWIGESFQGKGIVTDCCRVMIAHALGELELNRVEIHCAVSNVKSAAVPRRLGFQLEGTLREANFAGDRFHDVHIFGMLRKDWRA
jgi:ribosomal-protein-serine acetyltransferase